MFTVVFVTILFFMKFLWTGNVGFLIYIYILRIYIGLFVYESYFFERTTNGISFQEVYRSSMNSQEDGSNGRTTDVSAEVDDNEVVGLLNNGSTGRTTDFSSEVDNEVVGLLNNGSTSRTTDVSAEVDNNSKDLDMVDEFSPSSNDDSVLSSDNDDTFSYSSKDSAIVSNDTSDVYSSFLNSDNSNDISMFNSDSSSENINNAYLLPIIHNELNILNNVAKSIPELISFSNYVNQEQRKWGGSPPGKKGNKDRNFSSAYERIMQ